jgi:hypothetical protein
VESRSQAEKRDSGNRGISLLIRAHKCFGKDFFFEYLRVEVTWQINRDLVAEPHLAAATSRPLSEEEFGRGDYPGGLSRYIPILG